MHTTCCSAPNLAAQRRLLKHPTLRHVSLHQVELLEPRINGLFAETQRMVAGASAMLGMAQPGQARWQQPAAPAPARQQQHGAGGGSVAAAARECEEPLPLHLTPCRWETLSLGRCCVSDLPYLPLQVLCRLGAMGLPVVEAEGGWGLLLCRWGGCAGRRVSDLPYLRQVVWRDGVALRGAPRLAVGRLPAFLSSSALAAPDLQSVRARACVVCRARRRCAR